MKAYQWIFNVLQLITVIVGAQITPGRPVGHLWMALIPLTPLLFLFWVLWDNEVCPLFSPSPLSSAFPLRNPGSLWKAAFGKWNRCTCAWCVLAVSTGASRPGSPLLFVFTLLGVFADIFPKHTASPHGIFIPHVYCVLAYVYCGSSERLKPLEHLRFFFPLPQRSNFNLFRSVSPHLGIYA